MVIRLLICLLALVGISMSPLAQDNLLPRCSNAQLATLAEIQPTYETLIAEAQTFSAQAGYVSYIEAYLDWREQLKPQLPICAEMFEIALLMDRIASNQVAIPPLNSALLGVGWPVELNPFTEELTGESNLPDRLELQIEMAEARLNDDTGVSPEESDLPACTDTDYDIFYDAVFDPYLDMIETAVRGRSVRNLLRMVETLIAWRSQFWHSLPACAGMHEITWTMSHAASDFFVYAAFDLADMKPEADLFEAASARNSAAVAEMTPAFLGEAIADVTLPDSSLPGCARSQLNDFLPILLEYAELSNATEDVASIDDVFAFGRRQYEWREERLSDLPRCAEAFELGLLIGQSTDDIVLAMALLLVGIDYDDIPHLEAIEAGSARMSALVTPIIQGERAGTDAPVADPLPQCTDAQLALITSEIELDYWALMSAYSLAETVGDFLQFGELQIEFRQSVWNRLPACAEAYDIAWLMYRVTGDSAITQAFLIAGAAEDDIPYNAPALANMRLLTDMLIEIDAATSEADN